MGTIHDLSHERSGQPCDVEAEQALLGMILADNRLVDDLADQIAPEMFYEGVHARLFAKIARLVQGGNPADPVTVFHGEGDANLIKLGGQGYLVDLYAKAPPTSVARGYADAIRRLWQQREMLVAFQDGVTGVRQGVDPDLIIEAAERALLAVQVQSRGVHLVTAAEAAERVLIQFENPRAAFGVKTGMDPLDDVTGGFMPGELWLLAGRPGMGKAQPLDAKVLLADGRWCAMGLLRVGDQLASVDGEKSEVVATHERGQLQCYRIIFSDGRSTEVTGDHLWRVHHRKWREARVHSTNALIELIARPDGRKRIWIDLPSGNAGQPGTLPIDPWLLGALLANGALTKGSPAFTCGNGHVTEKLRSRLPPPVTAKPDGPLGLRLSTDRGQPNPLLERLRNLGIWGLKSTEKFIPAMYLSATRSERLDLLQGLMDNDGWMEKFGCSRVGFSSKQLADDVVTLARSLGYWASQHKKAPPSFRYKGETRTGHDHWTTTIVAHEQIFTNPAKMRPTVERTRKMPVIVSIEPTRLAPARCITVSHPSALYVTDDYVVTHNSAIGSSTALNIALNGRGPSGEPLGVIEICSEMTVEQMTRRHVADLGHQMFGRDMPSYSAIRKRALGPQQQRMFREALQRFHGLGTLRSLYRTGLTVSGLRGIIRRQKAAWARDGITLGLVTIDHMGLVRPSQATRSRNEAQGEVARDTKEIAGELNVPLLALVQLNRKVEERDDHRPLLSDLRDTGEWEENADGVIGVYREAYYAQREPEPKRHDLKLLWDERRSSPFVDAIFMKIREGEAQTVRLWADMGRNAIRGETPNDFYRAPMVDLLDPDVALPHDGYDGSFD